MDGQSNPSELSKFANDIHDSSDNENVNEKSDTSDQETGIGMECEESRETGSSCQSNSNITLDSSDQHEESLDEQETSMSGVYILVMSM